MGLLKDEWRCPWCDAREIDRLRNALVEAQPYVFSRIAEDGWRGETARDVLARVDVAVRLSSRSAA